MGRILVVEDDNEIRVLAHAILERRGYRVIEAVEGEEAATNLIRFNEPVFLRTGFPKTLALLQSEGYKVITLSADQAALVDGGLSCMSLRFFQPE